MIYFVCVVLFVVGVGLGLLGCVWYVLCCGLLLCCVVLCCVVLCCVCCELLVRCVCSSSCVCVVVYCCSVVRVVVTLL